MPTPTANEAPSLLALSDVRVDFPGEHGPVAIVDALSLQVGAGETLGLVGESGCGKSMTALAVMGLVPSPGRISAGRILFEGRELLALSERERRKLRGRKLAMVFQEPMTSLNPVYTAGAQVIEVLELHLGLTRAEARRRTLELFDEVGIGEPAMRADQYPHQLSGGLRQRVMIAMALACGPSLLIADEPTTALDVTIQAQILELLRELQRSKQLSILLITHDLGVVAENAQRAAVMYAGRIVEEGPSAELFATPAHPYTLGLFGCLPANAAQRGRLVTIPGRVPSPTEWPSGCRFRPRCPLASERCALQPLLETVPGPAATHRVACHHSAELLARRARGESLW